jgi:holo-[acyl-carrier protein] synthase
LIYGIGTDILDVSRLRHLSKTMGAVLPRQVLGPLELEVYSGMAVQEIALNYLARRFAAKEAFIKAANEPKLDMREVQVLNDEKGKPLISLSGKAMLNFGKWNHHVSISDDGDLVAATVILESAK